MSAGTERYPAPAVEYPVGRSGRLGVTLLLAHVGSVAVLIAWLVQGAGAQRVAFLSGMLLWSTAAALAARFWRRQPVGTLVWDGAGWQLRRAPGILSAQPLGSAVVVQLDLQRQMALVFPAARPVAWLFVEQKRLPARWIDLRRAVYSRPKGAKAAPTNGQHEGHSS